MSRHKKPCPLCGKPTTWENNPFHPFCSERCKIIDLGHWASGKYRVPGEKVPDKTMEEEGENKEKEEKK